MNGHETITVHLPGTLLSLDSNSNSTIVSPGKSFRFEARNPSEAKYILYSYKIGEFNLKIPADNKTMFSAVVNYEKYCQRTKEICFTKFLTLTHDEELAEQLVKEVVKKIDLRC